MYGLPDAYVRSDPGTRAARVLFFHKPKGAASYLRPIGGLTAHTSTSADAG